MSANCMVSFHSAMLKWIVNLPIISVKKTDDVFVSLYQDMLLQYASKGESWSERDPPRKNALGLKRDQAKKAAAKLAETVPNVRDWQNEKARAARKRPHTEEVASLSDKEFKRLASAAKKKSMQKPPDLSKDPNSVIGMRIAKFFENPETKAEELYFGTITKRFLPEETVEKLDFWHVAYDDGDDEDWSAGQVHFGLVLYSENEDKDPSPVIKP